MLVLLILFPAVIQKDLQDQALRQLLTHIPDIVIDSDHTRPMPQVKHLIGVVLFADISGEFTQFIKSFLVRQSCCRLFTR